VNRWTPGGEILTDLILQSFRVHGGLLAEGDRIAGEFGQSSARWQVLGATDAGAKTVPGIARAMGLTRQSVQRTVDLLEADGLVTYRDNPAHRRSKLVEMTPRGREIYQGITEGQVAWVNDLSRRMNARIVDMQTALDLIRKLGAVLSAKDAVSEG
jgi:DNA-binding MarR family transcriptional regulator